jgi:hypothetical protein
MFKKITKKKILVIFGLIGLIIYFNEDIRAYIYLKSNDIPIEAWSMLKKESGKMQELKNLFESQNDSIIFPNNQTLFEDFKNQFNNNDFKNSYNLFSEEFNQNHSSLNIALFFKKIWNDYGIIDSFKKDEIEYSFSENRNYFKSKENYITNFRNGVGSISIVVNMYDSINTKINEIGFQLDSSYKINNIIKKQKESLFQLLENNNYVKLNELTTTEYKIKLSINNFKDIENNFLKNKKINLTHTFIKLKAENDNSDIILIYEAENKMLEINLEIDAIGNYKINNFELTK